MTTIALFVIHSSIGEIIVLSILGLAFLGCAAYTGYLVMTTWLRSPRRWWNRR